MSVPTTKLQQFKSFYDEQLVPSLNKVESKRKRLLFSLSAISIAYLVLCGVLALYVFEQDPSMLFYFSPFFIIVGMGLYISYETIIKSSGYYNSYKKEVISKIIQFINPTLNYDKRTHVHRSLYMQSGFFPREKVVIDGDDHLSGSSNQIRVEFSEMVAKYQSKAVAKQYGESKNQFQGIFFVAHYPENFAADFVIEPASENSIAHEDPTQDLIDLENSDFGNYFQLRTLPLTTAYHVRQVLTDEFVTRLVSLKEQIHNDMYVSFVDNKMFVGILHDKELFEPSLFNSNKNFDTMQTHFNNLYYPVHLIDVASAHLQLGSYSRQKA